MAAGQSKRCAFLSIGRHIGKRRPPLNRHGVGFTFGALYHADAG
jgi:hypothetical protein